MSIQAEVLVQAAIFFALLPILIIEGTLAALYVADLDISRLQRLLDSTQLAGEFGPR